MVVPRLLSLVLVDMLEAWKRIRNTPNGHFEKKRRVVKERRIAANERKRAANEKLVSMNRYPNFKRIVGTRLRMKIKIFEMIIKSFVTA